MSDLQIAIITLVHTFNKYSGLEGKAATLSKAEVKRMMETELPKLAQNPKSKADVDKLLTSLDCNGDNEVDFIEFMGLVGVLGNACHECICKK